MTRHRHSWYLSAGVWPRREWCITCYRERPARPDPVDAIRVHSCGLCGRPLLIAEAGPHYRAEHPDDRPVFNDRDPRRVSA